MQVQEHIMKKIQESLSTSLHARGTHKSVGGMETPGVPLSTSWLASAGPPSRKGEGVAPAPRFAPPRPSPPQSLCFPYARTHIDRSPLSLFPPFFSGCATRALLAVYPDQSFSPHSLFVALSRAPSALEPLTPKKQVVLLALQTYLDSLERRAKDGTPCERRERKGCIVIDGHWIPKDIWRAIMAQGGDGRCAFQWWVARWMGDE